MYIYWIRTNDDHKREWTCYCSELKYDNSSPTAVMGFERFARFDIRPKLTSILLTRPSHMKARSCINDESKNHNIRTMWYITHGRCWYFSFHYTLNFIRRLECRRLWTLEYRHGVTRRFDFIGAVLYRCDLASHPPFSAHGPFALETVNIECETWTQC